MIIRFFKKADAIYFVSAFLVLSKTKAKDKVACGLTKLIWSNGWSRPRMNAVNFKQRMKSPAYERSEF